MGEFNYDAPPMISHYTGALSMFGSFWILVDILSDRKKKLKASSNRIIMVVSALDLFSSFWYFMGNWAQPIDENNGFSNDNNKHGTIGSCTASGFFIQLGTMAIPLYNTTLAMQYLLSIRYNWRDDRIWKEFEQCAHAIIIPLAIVLSIIPIPLELYNPWYFYCWITPNGWENDSFVRGTRLSSDFFYAIYFALVFSAAIVVTVIMIALYLTVRKTVRRSRAYDFENQVVPAGAAGLESSQIDSSLNSSDRKPSSGTSSSMFTLEGAKRMIKRSTSTARRQKRDARTHQVAIMALLYTIPFYLTWVIPACVFLKGYLVWRGMARWQKLPRLQYAMQVYVAVAMPLQGFMNWFAYMFPRIQTFFKKRLSQYCHLSLCCGKSSTAADSQEEAPSESQRMRREEAAADLNQVEDDESMEQTHDVTGFDSGDIIFSSIDSIEPETGAAEGFRHIIATAGLRQQEPEEEEIVFCVDTGAAYIKPCPSDCADDGSSTREAGALGEVGVMVPMGSEDDKNSGS
uniref:Uncharacterized protein n=1 Tax=Entomoneis paludosa TaxID=265537 RepID=A0A6U2YBH5_9STRA|mmetsp:Transcript_162/g.433  ORF Transcript_162/g.433 Transcript_162/m.433 type:complete len:516 (+) Transcript_162:229-1776(+)